MLRKIIRYTWDKATHWWGGITRKYYFEDFIRVYPNGVAYNRYGSLHSASNDEINNYLNHRKFYAFAAQFARRTDVVDIGCGSGYGCEMLSMAGATSVQGADISKAAIGFALKQFGNLAQFSVQGITDLNQYAAESFGLSISSEVLEHIKEYGKESLALGELKRITRPGGIVIIGTPNSELLGDHGFHFEELNRLVSKFFSQYVIFENALIPFGEDRLLWEKRLANQNTGIVVSQEIDLSETLLPEGANPEIKHGIDSGTYKLGNLSINTALLHNTHSWIVVAVKT